MEEQHSHGLGHYKKNRQIDAQELSKIPCCKVDGEAIAEQHRRSQNEAEHPSAFEAPADQSIAPHF